MQGNVDEERAMERCPWAGTDPLYISYHDEEWGVPIHDDRTHFEFLVLESAQAGLSWLTILRRRENYRIAYEGFDPFRVSRFGPEKITELLGNRGIIRNRKKIESSVQNAHRFVELQKEFGSFDAYLWAFVDGRPVVNSWESLAQIPSQTGLSDRITEDLKRRGFRFIGSTILYSHLQAVGVVNDHLVQCFRYQQILKSYR
jgi:DNA-3-methyladenine glycosylase I